MRLVSFSKPGVKNRRMGVVIDDFIIDLKPMTGFTNLFQLLDQDEAALAKLRQAVSHFRMDDLSQKADVYPLADVTLRIPLRPQTLRDFYAFEQHVKTANENRGRDIPKEWYDFPVFYFSNPGTAFGPDEPIPYPLYTEKLDYELEVACVIGKKGRNIPAAQAEEHIFGYMIFNDWSARDIQRREMAVGLGPAKGKDFASSFGPYLVTADELSDRHMGRPGVFDLEMTASVNGIEKSRGNWRDLYWSFGQMIERASDEVTLYPGEVIGSGTVGTGCLLELTRGEGPWLQPGDVVALEIERLGSLQTTIGEKVTIYEE